MTAINCKNIRGEIDEADLNQQLSNATVEHLRACTDCRAFHDERGGLRNLMSSLGTVAAPPDFDFRLRARLAREKASPRGAFALGKFLIGARSLAVVALMLLVVGTGIIIRNRMSSSQANGVGLARNSSAGGGASRGAASTAARPAQPQPMIAAAPKDHDLATGGEPRQRRRIKVHENNREPTANAVMPNKTAVRDAGELGATVITLNQPTETGSFVRVPIDGQSWKVSIDDGHGSSHTISVPAVSFGSQRVGEHGFSFAPVKSTKGAW